MNRLTSKEALKLVPEPERTADEIVNDVLEFIKDWAKKGKTKLKTCWEYSKDRKLWDYGGYNNTSKYKEVCKILKDLGYKVEFHYDESGQFVDMYTIIDWSGDES